MQQSSLSSSSVEHRVEATEVLRAALRGDTKYGGGSLEVEAVACEATDEGALPFSRPMYITDIYKLTI